MEGNQIPGLLFSFAKLSFVKWSAGIILTHKYTSALMKG